MSTHPIEWPESFAVRRPVLAIIAGRWKLVDSGKKIEFDLPLTSYSPHERDMIEFALNPYITGKEIFTGLDKPIAQLLANAIYQLFGPNGVYSTNNPGGEKQPAPKKKAGP